MATINRVRWNDMAPSKSKSMSMAESYEKVWTPEQRDAWQALGAFIYQLRRDGKIGVRK